MSVAGEHIYFADLNCPFCYALDERIQDLGLAEEAAWQGVQHLLTAEQWRQVTPELLATELNRLRKLAPDLEIREPPRLPPTGLPIVTVAELGLADAKAAARLRRALYRALWVDGQDISSPAVIGQVCRSLGIAVPKPTVNARALVASWQTHWEQGGFDRRIPVLVSPGGARAIGLEAIRRVATFLKAGLISSESDAVCRSSPD
jgi:2-hydroxychromene-2-carboxylate isomerase